MDTPTAGVIHGLLYGASRVDETLEHDIDAFDASRFESEATKGGIKRPSIYIEAFEGTHDIGDHMYLELRTFIYISRHDPHRL